MIENDRKVKGSYKEKEISSIEVQTRKLLLVTLYMYPKTTQWICKSFEKAP